MLNARLFTFTLGSVYAKPRLSQVNDRQNLSATGKNFGFTMTGKNLEL